MRVSLTNLLQAFCCGKLQATPSWSCSENHAVPKHTLLGCLAGRDRAKFDRNKMQTQNTFRFQELHGDFVQGGEEFLNHVRVPRDLLSNRMLHKGDLAWSTLPLLLASFHISFVALLLLLLRFLGLRQALGFVWRDWLRRHDMWGERGGPHFGWHIVFRGQVVL